MSADISILVSADRGILVPSRAVSTVRSRSYVKVYEEEGEEEIKTKRVTVGADDGVNVAVLEGLAEGELVVLPDAAGAAAPSQLSQTSQPQGSSGSSIIPLKVPGTGSMR